jgi:hypothetical protein
MLPPQLPPHENLLEELRAPECKLLVCCAVPRLAKSAFQAFQRSLSAQAAKTVGKVRNARRRCSAPAAFPVT